MPAPESHDSTLHKPWEIAQKRFLDNLGGDTTQRKLYHEATIENMISAATNIERDDRVSKARSVGRRLQPLVTAVTELAEGFDAFANAAPLYLAPIWGSIRVVLVIASKYRKFYDKIVDTLSHIGDVLPRLRDYKRTFDGVKHSRLTQALSSTFADIIILCLEIKNLLCLQQRSTFQRMWKPLSISVNKQLDDAVDRFRMHKMTVEAEATTAHMIEEADVRALILRSNALAEANRKAELRNRLLSSLSRLDQGMKHQKLRKICHLNTGTWLVLCCSYKDWLGTAGSTTFCLYGIPGCGKSVLSSIVIEDLRCSKMRSNLSYHYCDYSDKRSLDPINIFGSLAHGLLSKIEIPEAIASDIAEFYQDGSRTPDADEVLQVLSATLAELDSVILVIDGLDELAEHDRHYVCRSLKELLSNCTNTIKLFVTSRDNATSAFVTLHSTTFRAQVSPDTLATDIDSFVRHSVRILLETGHLKFRETDLEETIVNALVDGAKGMFLWVKYQLDDICNAETDEDIVEVLSNLPDSLSETYDRILKRISGYKRQELIKRMFRWIISARRPLSLLELCEGIAFTLEDHHWDGKKIPTDMDRLIRGCGSLVIIDEETSTVEFAHYTLQQYILQEVNATASPFHFSLREANEVVADTCLAYLCFSDFETQVIRHTTDNLTENMSAIEKVVTTGSVVSHSNMAYNAIRIWKNLHDTKVTSSNIDFEKHLPNTKQPLRTEALSTRFCLLEYATENWLHHTTELFPELSRTIATMGSGSLPQVLAEAKKSLIDNNVNNHRRYVLFLDLAIRKQLLFEIRPWKISPRTSKEWSHISRIGWALANNHLPLLYLSSIYDSSIKPSDLIETASKLVFTSAENRRITRHMRENLKSTSHKTPSLEIDPFTWLYSKLLDACRHGYIDTLRILLPPVSSQEYPASHIRGHLVFEAVAAGQHEVVAFLCANPNQLPADICSSYEKHKCNALDMAALQGQVTFVKSLRDYGYKATSVLTNGLFLLEAVERESIDRVEAILEAFKSLTTMDRSLQQQKIQALSKACMRTNIKILKLLLDDGVDPTAPDASGRSAMVSAVNSGQYETVKLMLDYGYGAAGFYGSVAEAAPILWACALGNTDLAMLFIDYGAEILPTRSHFWHNPLFIAAANGHTSIIELFAEIFDNFKEQNPDKLNPLYEIGIYNKTAQYTGNRPSSLPSLLLPLWAAKINGNTNIAKIFEEKYLYHDLVHICDWPKFLEESFWDHPPILKLLIATRKDPNSLNSNGDSLLTYAVAMGQSIAVESLILARADVGLPNSSGNTPLSIAVSRADTKLVRVLLEAGAKPRQEELLVALDRREHGILEELLSHGADTEMRVREETRMILGKLVPKGATLLIIAARGGDLVAIQLLLKAGANAEATDEYSNRTALFHAAQTKNMDCARFLETLNMKNHMLNLFGMKV